MTKPDTEILLEILVRVEKVGSFCPEKLMRSGRNRIFEEAYRRFDTWDEIVEKSVRLSNEQDLIGKRLKTPREIVVEILRLEGRGESMYGLDVAERHDELYVAAVMFYGSWNRTLAIVGIKPHGKIRDPPQ